MPDNNPPDAVAAPARADLPFRLELPPAFTGDSGESFNSWITRFEVAVNVSSSQVNKAKLLPARLCGPAFAYWQSLPTAIKDDYDRVKERLAAVFGRAQFLATFQTYITARPRKPSEPLELYLAELSCLVEEAFPNYGEEAKKCELFRRFVAGLDSSLQLKVHEHGATTVDLALKIASQCERAQLALNINSPSQLMSVTAPTHMLPTPTPHTGTDLATAITQMQADIKDIKQQQRSRRTDDQLEFLSDKVARLQLEVNAVSMREPRRETRYSRDDNYNRDVSYRHRPERQAYSPRRDEYYDYSAPARRDSYDRYGPRNMSQRRREYSPSPRYPPHDHDDYSRGRTETRRDDCAWGAARYGDSPYGARAASPRGWGAERSPTPPASRQSDRQDRSGRRPSSPGRRVRFNSPGTQRERDGDRFQGNEY